MHKFLHIRNILKIFMKFVILHFGINCYKFLLFQSQFICQKSVEFFLFSQVQKCSSCQFKTFHIHRNRYLYIPVHYSSIAGCILTEIYSFFLQINKFFFIQIRRFQPPSIPKPSAAATIHKFQPGLLLTISKLQIESQSYQN